MRDERSLKVLLAPHISEKVSSNSQGGYRQYAFKVMPDATKPEIKRAVEELFKVQVRSVRVLNAKGKTARFRQTLGRRSGWRKAYVTLAQGQEIDVAEI